MSALLKLIGWQHLLISGYQGLGIVEAGREALCDARVGLLRRFGRHRQREPRREVHAGGSGRLLTDFM